MTFGEHLDELRMALMKSILALVIGFLIALVFARSVVQFVQTPLKDALKDYYVKLARHDYAQMLTREHGDVETEALDAAADRLKEQQFVAEDRYISRQEWLDILKAIESKEDGKSAVDLPAPDTLLGANDLVKFRIYHRVDDDPRVRVIALNVGEAFVIYMKAAVVVGAILASPFVFYFIWQFVAAGLYPHEQRYVHIFLPFSLILFLAGACSRFSGFSSLCCGSS